MFGRGHFDLTLFEIVEAWAKSVYHEKWACKRGKHYMKMNSCVYCKSVNN